MDNQKKISETYKSDKDSRKEKVVVGLNGGVDSFVTAYLLKIQKYDLIGVTVINSFPTGSSDFLSCHITQPDVEKIKNFCKQLGIPHQIIRPVDEFNETVIESWVNSKMTGSFNNSCRNCHEERMKTLYNKMLSMDAKFLATGHYAKIFRHESLHTVFLHTANDEKHDQAALLSGLPSDLLNRLMLPLSDLQKKEVIKLAENFGFDLSQPEREFGHCFDNSPVLDAYLKKCIPVKLRPIGDIFLEDEGQKIDTHEGMYALNYGDPFNSSGISQDTYFVSGYVSREKKALLNQQSYFMRHRVQLLNCKITDETNWNEPFKGSVQFSDGTQADCWVYPKALHRALVSWEGLKELKEGEILAITKKAGKNAKIYFTGRVKFLKEKNDEGDKENVQKIDYSRDF